MKLTLLINEHLIFQTKALRTAFTQARLELDGAEPVRRKHKLEGILAVQQQPRRSRVKGARRVRQQKVDGKIARVGLLGQTCCPEARSALAQRLWPDGRGPQHRIEETADRGSG